jgi:DNA replication protein DnaC
MTTKAKETTISREAEQPKKKKQSRAVQIYSVKRLQRKKFKPVAVGEYSSVLGEIEGNCNVIAYGSSGSGKTTFILKLANYLSKKYGKALYVSYEEDTNKSVVERTKRWNIDSEKLYFAGRMNYDQLVDKVHKNKYRVLVIDSLQYANFTYQNLIDFRARFKKRNIILLMLSFGNALGKTLGFNDHLHASDVKLYFNQGELTSVSRYLGSVVKKQLFKPEEVKSEGALFDNQEL